MKTEKTWWMLEHVSGAGWLQDADHETFTADPNAALRWPNRWAAEVARQGLHSPLWHQVKHGATEHKWIGEEPTDWKARATALEVQLAAAERERDELRLDITGGEDAPGYNASLSHQTIRDILAENYRSWRDSSDRYVTASAQLAAAREALEEAARVAAGPDYPALRAAIERARAALAPHPEKEEADHG